MRDSKNTGLFLVAGITLILLGLGIRFTNPTSEKKQRQSAPVQTEDAKASYPDTKGKASHKPATGEKKTDTAHLTVAEEMRLADAVAQLLNRCRDIERKNAKTVFEKVEGNMSTVAVRIPEPSPAQCAEINELANQLEATLADIPDSKKPFRAEFQKLWSQYGPFRPGWPFKVVYLRVFDEGTEKVKVTSIVGYLPDEASTIPEENGKLVFPDGSHASSTIWDGSLPYGRWARERYGYLFEIDGKKH